MTIQIICPNDSTLLLNKNGEYYHCPVCNKNYPVENGVIRLLDNNDKFYEGSYENQTTFIPSSEKLWHVWPLWLINSGYPWVVRRFVPKKSLVVELGCAGGVKYFGKRYQMVGCDLSFSSLTKLNDIYSHMLQSDVTSCIPLSDNSVDAVVSSYFWEHIPPNIKPHILSECYRILRPGGKIIFLYDVETKNPLINHYKKNNLKLYNRLFLEGDGHIGYQSPDENLALFHKAKFSICQHLGLEKTWVQSPSVYSKLAQFGNLAHYMFTWSKVFGKSPLFYFYTALMRIIDFMICPFLPKSWARINLVICEKNHLK